MNWAWEEAPQFILPKNVVTDFFDKGLMKKISYVFFERSKYKEFRMFFFERSIYKEFPIIFWKIYSICKEFCISEAADFPIPPPLWSSRQVDLLETNSFETPSKVNKSRRSSKSACMMPQQLHEKMLTTRLKPC